jgi:hypothetical protein
VAEVGAEGLPAWGIDGGRRQLPRRCGLRRGCVSGWTKREPGVSSDC